MLVCNDVKREGVESMVAMAYDEVVASIAGSEAEKTEAAELIRWWAQTTLDPAQKPPPAPREVAMEPMMMSTSDA